MFISVDIEADGPIPGKYSMVSLGAVVVDGELDKRFYATIKPISEEWDKEALAISGFTREETLEFAPAEKVMKEFAEWVKAVSPKRAIFVSDNAGFDWMFVCWYFWTFVNENPFGFSSLSLTSLYKGIQKDMYASIKKLRRTKHSHNALDDALGNAEALLTIINTEEIKGCRR